MRSAATCTSSTAIYRPPAPRTRMPRVGPRTSPSATTWSVRPPARGPASYAGTVVPPRVLNKLTYLYSAGRLPAVCFGAGAEGLRKPRAPTSDSLASSDLRAPDPDVLHKLALTQRPSRCPRGRRSVRGVRSRDRPTLAAMSATDAAGGYMPIAWYPLSTYSVVPVTLRAPSPSR